MNKAESKKLRVLLIIIFCSCSMLASMSFLDLIKEKNISIKKLERDISALTVSAAASSGDEYAYAQIPDGRSGGNLYSDASLAIEILKKHGFTIETTRTSDGTLSITAISSSKLPLASILQEITADEFPIGLRSLSFKVEKDENVIFAMEAYRAK